MNKLFLIASAALLMAGCSRPPTQLIVVNGSAATLTNVVASGQGFSVPVASLASGAKAESAVTAGGKGIKLDFDVDGRHISIADPGSVSEFKSITATIGPDFKMSVSGITRF